MEKILRKFPIPLIVTGVLLSLVFFNIKGNAASTKIMRKHESHPSEVILYNINKDTIPDYAQDLYVRFPYGAVPGKLRQPTQKEIDWYIAQN